MGSNSKIFVVSDASKNTLFFNVTFVFQLYEAVKHQTDFNELLLSVTK